MDAVQSIGQLSNSVINSRKNDKFDEFDDDWLFAKSIYIKLKDVPSREAKERFKMRMQNELMNLIFGDQSKQPTSAQFDAMGSVQRQAPLRPIIIYRHSQTAGHNNPQQYVGSQIQFTTPMQMFASVPPGNNVSAVIETSNTEA